MIVLLAPSMAPHCTPDKILCDSPQSGSSPPLQPDHLLDLPNSRLLSQSYAISCLPQDVTVLLCFSSCFSTWELCLLARPSTLPPTILQVLSQNIDHLKAIFSPDTCPSPTHQPESDAPLVDTQKHLSLPAVQHPSFCIPTSCALSLGL